jgi:hypothetical protein
VPKNIFDHPFVWDLLTVYSCKLKKLSNYREKKFLVPGLAQQRASNSKMLDYEKNVFKKIAIF